LPASVHSTTLSDLLRIAAAELGPDTVVELDQELILSLKCPTCQTVEQILKPISEVSFESAHCPTCGAMRETEMTHAITGAEPFLNRTLASVGVPPLHILRAFNAQEYRFYEMTGDLLEALHFRDFEGASPARKDEIRKRIRLSDTVRSEEIRLNPARGKVILRD
ncbi:MAG: hypothetical protein IT316_05545, partial [Anaerolineales bacterium]|nr:hypothetical protein [Anaerolineales bacterium]